MVGVALIGGLILTVLVTAVVTYRPTPAGERPRSNWRQALPWATIFYAGNVALTSTHLAGVGLVGLALMLGGFIGLLRNRNHQF